MNECIVVVLLEHRQPEHNKTFRTILPMTSY